MANLGTITYGDQKLEGIIPESVHSEGRLLEGRSHAAVPILAPLEAVVWKSLTQSSTPEKVSSVQEILTKKPETTVTITVDDYARPNIHTRAVLPILLQQLQEKLNVPREHITLLIGGGTHRPPKDAQEWLTIFGSDVWPMWKDRVVVHSSREGNVDLGLTADGIPVLFDQTAYDSELLILLTDVTYHYFAGYGGGPKSLMPALCGDETIRREHLRMFGSLGFAQHVDMGSIEHNPVFQTKLEIVDVIQNAMQKEGRTICSFPCVVNRDGEIVYLGSGGVLETHATGRAVLDQTFEVHLEKPADVVIMGTRAYGLDLYQTGKALHAASLAVKKGGRILMVSPCRNGFGNDTFKELMQVSANILGAGGSLDEALAQVQKEVMAHFVIGKQKPVDLLSILKKCGPGRISMVQEGLTAEEKKVVPFEFIEGTSPAERVRLYVDRIEKEEPGSTFIVLDDPDVWVRILK